MGRTCRPGGYPLLPLRSEYQLEPRISPANPLGAQEGRGPLRGRKESAESSELPLHAASAVGCLKSTRCGVLGLTSPDATVYAVELRFAGATFLACRRRANERLSAVPKPYPNEPFRTIPCITLRGSKRLYQRGRAAVRRSERAAGTHCDHASGEQAIFPRPPWTDSTLGGVVAPPRFMGALWHRAAATADERRGGGNAADRGPAAGSISLSGSGAP